MKNQLLQILTSLSSLFLDKILSNYLTTKRKHFICLHHQKKLRLTTRASLSSIQYIKSDAQRLLFHQYFLTVDDINALGQRLG